MSMLKSMLERTAVSQRASLVVARGVGISALLLVGCAEMPTGPSVAVMPAPNKPFDVFMQDDQLCRDWAAHSIGIPGHDGAAEALLKSTVTGAAIGAVVGGLAGGDRGAGAGAAIGTAVGASAGANAGAYSAATAQRRYDIAYQQCMYSKGNVVSNYPHPGYYYPPPPNAPPPPGTR